MRDNRLLLWKLWRDLNRPHADEMRAYYVRKIINLQMKRIVHPATRVIRPFLIVATFIALNFLLARTGNTLSVVRISSLTFVLLLGLFLVMMFSPGTITGALNAWKQASTFDKGRTILPMLAVTPLGWLGAYWMLAEMRYRWHSWVGIHSATVVMYGLFMLLISISLTVSLDESRTETLFTYFVLFGGLYMEGQLLSFTGFCIGLWVGLWADVLSARMLALGLFGLVHVALAVLLILTLRITQDVLTWLPDFVELLSVFGLFYAFHFGLISWLLHRVRRNLDAPAEWQIALRL